MQKDRQADRLVLYKSRLDKKKVFNKYVNSSTLLC